MKDGHYVDWSDCVYRYSFLVDLSPKLLHFNFTQNVEYNLQRPYGGIADDDKGMKHLSSEDQWQVWKGAMKSITRQDNYNWQCFCIVL